MKIVHPICQTNEGGEESDRLLVNSWQCLTRHVGITRSTVGKIKKE